jgi:hypothetical protein
MDDGTGPEPELATPLQSKAMVARACNLTIRRIEQLRRDGVLPDGERGRMPLLATMMAYIRYLQSRAAQGSKRLEEDARLRGAQATLREIDAQEKLGTLVEFDDIAEWLGEFFVDLLQAHLALAPRLAQLMPDRAAGRKSIDEELRTLRDQLARAIAKRCEGFEARARRLEIAAAKDAGRVGRRRANSAGRKRGAGAVSIQ